MSRVGKKPIPVPSGVDVKISGADISVKGPKGKLDWVLPDAVNVNVQDQTIVVQRKDDSKEKRALHGLARSILSGMVNGVTDGYKRELELVGVGYRAQVQGNKLVFSLGYSHPVEFLLPDGITAEVDKKQTTIALNGIDKQLIGQTAANLKELRLPDAYKGKGVRYAGERIKLKPGKTGK